MMNIVKPSVKEKGSNNSVSFDETVVYGGECSVTIEGSNNKIFVGRNVDIRRMKVFFFGDNNQILIEPHCIISGLFSCRGDGNKIKIGKFTTMVDARFDAEYGSEITLGKDCMLSRAIEIRTGDTHSIIDADTGVRVNMPKSVKIGDHVWLGYGVNIGKGADIKGNTVVGSGSFCSQSLEEGNCVVAGVPAKIIKRNVIWDRKSFDNDVPQKHFENLKRNYFWSA